MWFLLVVGCVFPVSLHPNMLNGPEASCVRVLVLPICVCMNVSVYCGTPLNVT